MIAQYIQLGDRDWNVLVYYNVSKEDFVEIVDSLRQLDCPKEDVRKALKTLRRKNTGFTFSNTDYKMSIICIGEATNTAAYLIGHLVHRMYKMLENVLRQYI